MASNHIVTIVICVPSSSEVELYPPDSPRLLEEHPPATASRKPDMGYFSADKMESLGGSDGSRVDNTVAFLASPPRYAIPDLLTQLKSSRGKYGVLCWIIPGYLMSSNFFSRPMTELLIGRRSISTPISKSMLEAVVILSEEAEMRNSRGIPSTPTLTDAWNIPAKSNLEISLKCVVSSIGRRVLLAWRRRSILGLIFDLIPPSRISKTLADNESYGRLSCSLDKNEAESETISNN